MIHKCMKRRSSSLVISEMWGKMSLAKIKKSVSSTSSMSDSANFQSTSHFGKVQQNLIELNFLKYSSTGCLDGSDG